jgi:alpha-N-arabinofuranosidase
MLTAKIIADADFVVAPLDRRLFGSFVEHMGRCVYTGIYEPGHPDRRRERLPPGRAQARQGARRHRHPLPRRQLRVRLQLGRRHRPQGETAPPARRRLAHLEDQRLRPARVRGLVPAGRLDRNHAINLGTRGVDAAREIVEYANHPGGTYLSDLRARNGHKDPFNIKCGASATRWTVPGRSATRPPRNTAGWPRRPPRRCGSWIPDIELVACGSSNAGMPTFGAWEQTVLTHAYEEVDYVSLHAYYQEHDGDVGSFLASAVDTDYFIESSDRHDRRRRPRQGQAQEAHQPVLRRVERLVQRGLDTEDQPHNVTKAGWREHPRVIEDKYNVTDAVVVGTCSTRCSATATG